MIGTFNFPVVNVISFSPLAQQLPLLDHVTEITCQLFKTVQFDFEEGNLISGLIELLSSFAIATYAPDCAFEINKPRPPNVL